MPMVQVERGHSSKWMFNVGVLEDESHNDNVKTDSLRDERLHSR